jgi:hypothetical protein
VVAHSSHSAVSFFEGAPRLSLSPPCKGPTRGLVSRLTGPLWPCLPSSSNTPARPPMARSGRSRDGGASLTNPLAADLEAGEGEFSVGT